MSRPSRSSRSSRLLHSSRRQASRRPRISVGGGRLGRLGVGADERCAVCSVHSVTPEGGRLHPPVVRGGGARHPGRDGLGGRMTKRHRSSRRRRGTSPSRDSRSGRPRCVRLRFRPGAHQHPSAGLQSQDRYEPEQGASLVAGDGAPRWRRHDRDRRAPNDPHASLLLARTPAAR